MDIRIRVVKPGSADALTAEPYPPETPAPGEVRIRHEAIGVNFIDVYHRRALIPFLHRACQESRGPGSSSAWATA